MGHVCGGTRRGHFSGDEAGAWLPLGVPTVRLERGNLGPEEACAAARPGAGPSTQGRACPLF